MIGKILVFIFGSVVGSFLNVCIHRMPLGESIVWPHSHCPKCKKKIPTYDNIPFLSYIILKGRCRFCKGRISLRYPIVELLTALMFVALFDRYGLTYDFFIFSLFVSGLIIATFIDIPYHIIPDAISVGGIIFGFILTAIKGFNVRPFTYNPSHMLDSLLGILVGGGIIFLPAKIFDLVYFKILKRPPIQGETESMGLGDVMLLAMVGAFLGWQKVIFVFFLAIFLGVAVGLKNLRIKLINIRKTKDQDAYSGPALRIKIFNIATIVYFKEHLMPFGPFLSLAAIISIFWMDKIIRLIFP